MTLGRRIQELRKNFGLSQEELGERMGVSALSRSLRSQMPPETSPGRSICLSRTPDSTGHKQPARDCSRAEPLNFAIFGNVLPILRKPHGGEEFFFLYRSSIAFKFLY